MARKYLDPELPLTLGETCSLYILLEWDWEMGLGNEAGK